MTKPNETNIRIKKDTRDSLNQLKYIVGTKSADETINRALDLLQKEMEDLENDSS